jgi:2-polyprenyl-6-methoxyphenol hydroxylase-like FAD-dependent oxidoreductase
MQTQLIETHCCIAGGGPAGMMLGLLLARAGVPVLVLEKHADFLRDFRGDTIHPSTLEVMHELGLAEALLERPHQKASELEAQIGDTRLKAADFSHLPVHHRFIALMPQWDFLDFLAGAAKRYPGFRLMMNAEATGLVEENGRIVGLRARTPDGELEVRAGLVVAADGRHSTLRAAAALEVQDLGAPIDVLWLRLPRQAGSNELPLGRMDNGHILVLINRGDYWQCAYVIPKGGIETVKTAGLPAFRETLARLTPALREGVAGLRDWDQVKLLTVTVDRLRTWHRQGLLCIGDAAHAMSPVGGVGINLAIQDAVATANLLSRPLREGVPRLEQLAAVQRRREWPTRMTQGLQVLIHERVLSRVMAAQHALRAPLPVRLLAAWPILRRIPARIFGLGFRPEHVHSPAASERPAAPAAKG